jgi:hypothetical protein
MGLTFLYPAFLLGALATSVPVVIHLIYRRRALVHRFPAVRFLLLADQRTARKFRLRQWLLLALRMLIILLLALLLARPRLMNRDAQASVALPAQAMVLLIDNSLSMQYLDAKTPRLQRAKAVAASLLQALRPQDRALVLPLLQRRDKTPTALFLTPEQNALKQQLAAIEPEHAAVDIAGSLQRALTLLQESPVAQRRIVLLSDFTVHGWENFHLRQLSAIPEHVELHFIRLGEARRDPNLLIEAVHLGTAPLIEGSPIEVLVSIRNSSDEAVTNIRADLFVGRTKVGEQLVDLGAEERVVVPFRITAPAAGLHGGEVRIAHDRFPVDDRFYYALRTMPPARVLLVDGDPGASLFDSELFYLLSALQSSGDMGHSLFYAKPITWEGLERERLDDYQAVILCNVERLTAQIRQHLFQFAHAGGGIVMFVGNRVDSEHYNATLYHATPPLLPFALGAPVQTAEDHPMTLAAIDEHHPALTVFASQGELLRQAKFYRYYAMLQQPDTPDVKTLLTFRDGHPFLLERRLGKGRLMLFTSSADRDWTDLPTRTAYVPLIYGVLSDLTRLSSASSRPQIIMPEPFMFVGQPSDRDATITVRTPEGDEHHLRYSNEKGRLVGRFEDYSVPGLYPVRTPSGSDLLAVNATRAESHFEKLHDVDLQTRFRPLSLTIENEKEMGQGDSVEQFPVRELSGMLIVILVVALLVENAYSNRF